MARRAYLLGVDDVHDDAALEHACQSGLYGEAVALAIGLRDITVWVSANGTVAVADGEVGGHCGEQWRVERVGERCAVYEIESRN